MPRFRPLDRFLFRTLPPLGLIGLAACNGSARLEVISLHPHAIEPPAAETLPFDADRCFWWTDASGRLCMAMRFDAAKLFVPAPQSMISMSLVFPALPAGSARDYAVGRNELRATFDSGLQHDRFPALQGICAVHRDPDGRTLRGSFRIWVLHQPGPGLFDLMPRQPGPLLWQGKFTAIPDREEAGTALLAVTEAAGWSRPPPRTAAAKG